MSATHQEPEPTEHDPRLTAYLFDLMEIGAKVAQSLGRQADLQAQPESQTPSVDLADQFERVSRAMRRTALLIRHLAQPGTKTAHHRTQARKRIIRAVEDAIQSEGENPESLRAEFRDRLDGPDLDEEIANRPIQDIIVDIRRDLGLEHIPGTHPWARRSPREIEDLRTRAAAPRPPGPYTPAPHGPDPGAPKSNRPPRDPDRDQKELITLAKHLEHHPTVSGQPSDKDAR